MEQFWDHNASEPVDYASPLADDPEIEDVTPDADAIVIRTVVDAMSFDLSEFTVRAGQDVKIWFENPDYMPHNLIIGEPGSAEEIATAAEALGAVGFAVGFRPDSDKILVASELLNHREYQVIEFTAPTDTGDYDYLCTFPNHWQTMQGLMRVVDSVR